jgi:hypothetical protein
MENKTEDVRHILFRDLEEQVSRTLSVETALRNAVRSQQLEQIEFALGEAIAANISEKRLNSARNAIVRLERKRVAEREEEIVRKMSESIQDFAHSMGIRSIDALSASLEKMRDAGLHEDVLREATILTSRIRSEQNRNMDSSSKSHRHEKMSNFLEKELDLAKEKYYIHKARDCELNLRTAIKSSKLERIQIALLHGFDYKLHEKGNETKDLMTLAMVRMQEICTQYAKIVATEEQAKKRKTRARLCELAVSNNPTTLRVAISEAVKLGLEKDSFILKLVRTRMFSLFEARKRRAKLGNELKQTLSLIELKKRNTTEKELKNLRQCIQNASAANVDPVLIRRARMIAKRNENYLETQSNAVFAHDHMDGAVDYFDKNHHHIMGQDLRSLYVMFERSSLSYKCNNSAHSSSSSSSLSSHSYSHTHTHTHTITVKQDYMQTTQPIELNDSL